MHLIARLAQKIARSRADRERAFASIRQCERKTGEARICARTESAPPKMNASGFTFVVTRLPDGKKCVRGSLRRKYGWGTLLQAILARGTGPNSKGKRNLQPEWTKIQKKHLSNKVTIANSERIQFPHQNVRRTRWTICVRRILPPTIVRKSRARRTGSLAKKATHMDHDFCCNEDYWSELRMRVNCPEYYNSCNFRTCNQYWWETMYNNVPDL